jgi:hypothetical protein
MGKVKPSFGPNSYETFQIRPNGVLFYEEFVSHKRTERKAENQKNLTRGEFNGHPSKKTRSLQKRYLSNWIESINVHSDHYKQDGKAGVHKHITFVTLTLPAKQFECHDDNFIKREMLAPFIATCQRKYGVVNYFWRAEVQRNGNIHFHLLFDSYIEWYKVRSLWNRLIGAHGYIEQYRVNQLAHHANGFTARANSQSVEKQLLAYAKGTAENWCNPNSTDIHDVRKAKNITAYITKYITKDNTAPACDVETKQEIEIFLDRPICGRLWGCSDQIRELSFFHEHDCLGMEQVEPDNANGVPGRNELDIFKDAVRSTSKERWFSKSGIIFVPFDVRNFLRSNCPELYDRYCTFYLKCYQGIYGRAKIPAPPPPAPLELYEPETDKIAVEYLLF